MRKEKRKQITKQISAGMLAFLMTLSVMDFGGLGCIEAYAKEEEKYEEEANEDFGGFGDLFGGTEQTGETSEEETEKTWIDYAASEFAGGSGTKEDPYQIATAEQLAKLAKEVNSGVAGNNHSNEYFKLTASIDLSGHRWVPIGYGNSTNTFGFYGYFDGDNQTITGLYVDERGNNVDAGLFGSVVAGSTEAVLKNIYIENAEVYAGDEQDTNQLLYGAGVLAGTVGTGYPTEYVTVENCHVTGKVNSVMYAGGLIGIINYGQISGCTADTFVSGLVCSGGLTAFIYSTTLKNSTAKGDVDSPGWAAGGFVGDGEESSIMNCTAYGNVTAADWNVGGFAGYLWNTTVENSSAYGDVTGNLATNNPKAGGFVGTNDNGSTIKNSHAAGLVSGSNEHGSAGGFVACDKGGVTEGCSFDKTKNPTLEAVGGTEIEGTNDITAKNTDEVLADICKDTFGGHKYEETWTIDKPATCQEEGSKSYHCERCNDKKDVTVIAKISHSDLKLVKVEEKKATHLTEGNISYWNCSSCGKYFSDQAGTTEITLADTVLPKLAEHTKQTTVAKKATFTEAGSSVTKCTVCGETLATTVIPKISKVTLSKTSYTYDGKAKKPTVTVKDSAGNTLKNGTDYNVTYAKGRKNVGKYTVTVTLKGDNYSGTTTGTFEIKPKSTSLTSRSGQKKAITVKWKKQTKQTSGYQIQYGTKKNFAKAKLVTIKKNKTTKIKVKGLAAKKKYYVRIRTYKNVKVNGKTTKIFSAWSKSKTVKTK